MVTLTFLFTDVEGSTRRWDRGPDAMSAALRRHDEILRSTIESRGGQVFKTVGDAFYGAFVEPRAALDAAIDGQRALGRENWSAFGAEMAGLRVRMAIHHGMAEARDGDYFGPALNRAARLVAAGHGGQILVSSAARQVLVDYLPAGVMLRDRGEHRLRDLRHKEHIWEVTARGLPRVRDPLATADGSDFSGHIVVHEGGEVRSTVEVLSALAAAVREEGREVGLSPAEIRQVLEHRPTDLADYRLLRIAEWLQPRYRLGGRFVAPALVLDGDDCAAGGRRASDDVRHESLRSVLGAVHEPIVVLGPPGCGKSTLLRHLELEVAVRNLRGQDERDTVTCFVALNQYGPERPDAPPPAPHDWLTTRWTTRHPDLSPLDDLLAEGRVIFLLDGLNDLHGGERGAHERLRLWKAWLERLVAERPGNRVVFTCRTLDYATPLSTPELRVRHARVEPLGDEAVAEFLRLNCPARAGDIESMLAGRAELEMLRRPYFLALLAEELEATGLMPACRAALLTGFVRRSLRREVERGNAPFEPGLVLDPRDLKRIAHWQWRDDYDLPERGALIPGLCGLAHGLQGRAAASGRSQVRADLDEALALLDHPLAETILAAGEALGVLDEDQATETLVYSDSLLQEYFAARVLARRPDSGLVHSEWHADRMVPLLDEVIAALAPSEALPGPPRTGWEESTQLAAAMAGDASAFVRGVSEVNLPLAAAIAAEGAVGSRLPRSLVDGLRLALVERSRAPEGDPRDRIACGMALGELGDPRFERRDGPHGPYLWPQWIDVPAGTYPIGADDPIDWTWERTAESGTETDHIPRHDMHLEAFRIARFPVTNAEFAAFVAAGGYDDDRWWDTPDARRWRCGELASEGGKYNNRVWRRRFREDPALIERLAQEGLLADAKVRQRWLDWVALDEEGFEQALEERWRPHRRTEPLFWRSERYNGRAQPVVGVCWYEARAFANWLSAQSGSRVRLPTEVEWEAAVRGPEARDYPWGWVHSSDRANTYESHVRRPTPVGVFPAGDTPEGLCDAAGNVFEWTSSLWGERRTESARVAYRYPYNLSDGREAAGAPPDVARVARGGSWDVDCMQVRAVLRSNVHPDYSGNNYGLRLVAEVGSGHGSDPID